jgi:hypothetical protein
MPLKRWDSRVILAAYAGMRFMLSPLQMSEDVINRMMEEFEQMGRKEDFNSSLEGMMKQLLAKDLMYLPMKQICEKVRVVSFKPQLICPYRYMQWVPVRSFQSGWLEIDPHCPKTTTRSTANNTSASSCWLLCMKPSQITLHGLPHSCSRYVAPFHPLLQSFVCHPCTFILLAASRVR